MNLTDLNADERLALVGLVAYVANADGEVTDEEFAELGELGGEMGQEAFRDAFDESRRRFRTVDDVLAFAGDVDRQGARELIHTVLVDMAQTDGISDAERDIIGKVALMWGIRARQL